MFSLHRSLTPPCARARAWSLGPVTVIRIQIFNTLVQQVSFLVAAFDGGRVSQPRCARGVFISMVTSQQAKGSDEGIAENIP